MPILLLLLPTLFYQPGFVTKSLLNDRIVMDVPRQLVRMSDDMWNVKYPKRTRPLMVLTDSKGAVNLIADPNSQPLVDEQLLAYNRFQVKEFKKSHPDMILHGSGIKKIHNKKIGFLKFTTSALGQQVFNYYFFTSLDGKLLLFSFNCLEALRPTWEKTADQVVASLKIK